jgi:FdhE protein
MRERHPHAAELLTLYDALLDVWEEAWRAASADPPGALPGWAAEHVVPRVVACTDRFGPAPLSTAVRQLDPVEPILAGWLAGESLEPVERYLARAALRGPLEAVPDWRAWPPQNPLRPAPALDARSDTGDTEARLCPYCGGQPQLSFRTNADDPLVSGRRYLGCARCGRHWAYSAGTCASCGETAGRTYFAEHHDGPVIGRRRSDAVFPHLRIEACERCSRYLIDVDLGVDGRAVPEVDELTALPLDLFAAERGFTKIAPNLMGF